MRKTKNILIFVFAIIVVSALAYVIFLFFYVQKRYAEIPTDPKSIFTESRYLYGISSNDNLKLRTEYLLIKTVRDSVIKYEYKSTTDSTRNFKVSYLTKNQEIQFDFTDYVKYESNTFWSNSNSEIWFDMYEMKEPIIDGMSPVMFNKDYGILAIANPLGPSAFFMDKQNDSLQVMKISKKLY
ncbi:hypothetical protein JJL45_14295 [Tamlana sp. s12]|uniref:hypothetical protein n=1 Tax=Tamlana sp. s12 TaxID=1630406 RepID=UPI0007FF2002|nr:hypothetical protein [Tamlana sp. s12]OBQ54588.1 hypothetical protein VQ01_10560 [Tamlana sp. s12]QQY82078.1 hypothetical protein JJL45_14295 [Tamlana sp. s12]